MGGKVYDSFDILGGQYFVEYCRILDVFMDKCWLYVCDFMYLFNDEFIGIVQIVENDWMLICFDCGYCVMRVDVIVFFCYQNIYLLVIYLIVLCSCFILCILFILY